jgi:hypothetical protein
MIPPVTPVRGIHETDVPLRRSAVHFGVPRSRRDCIGCANNARPFWRTREQRVVIGPKTLNTGEPHALDRLGPQPSAMSEQTSKRTA